jgi:deoxycytidylate deaminase
MKTWDQYFIEMAFLVASKSKDPSTQVGCVIVGPDNEIRSTGFNGFPRGVEEMVDCTPHYVHDVGYDIYTRTLTATCNCGALVKEIAPPSEQWLASRHITMYDAHMVHAKLADHFNGPIGGQELSPRWERPDKYAYVEHAERNAVYNAARVGVPLEGCTAYLNWEPYPCVECAKAFIQAGIVEVVGPDIPFSGTSNHDWKFNKSLEMFNEAGVTYRGVAWNDETKDTA